MMYFNQWKSFYWLFILLLLLIPLTNSFIIGFKNLISSIVENKERKQTLSKLYKENRKLDELVRHYNSEEGSKALVKDRLLKVDRGELVIKYDE